MAKNSSPVRDWPFTVELAEVGHLFADHRYQRPPQAPFIDKMVNSFDETLVGVLDVSYRPRNSSRIYAILDGLQRFEAIKKVGKTTAYVAVYEGMSVADEAMFFYRKNKDRRSVHPFYSFRARMVAGDEKAIDINRIVESEGYKLEVGAIPPDNLTAIRAVEEAYSYSSTARNESLSATLNTLRRSFYDRQGGKDGELIRGLGRFFQPFYAEEIDLPWLEDRLANENPRTILGRARDNYHAGQYRSNPVAEEIIKVYNRGRKNGKLNRNLLTKTK
jgi:hypothetical protein